MSFFTYFLSLHLITISGAQLLTGGARWEIVFRLPVGQCSSIEDDWDAKGAEEREKWNCLELFTRRRRRSKRTDTGISQHALYNHHDITNGHFYSQTNVHM
jgi:hypothetical protein